MCTDMVSRGRFRRKKPVIVKSGDYPTPRAHTGIVTEVFLLNIYYMNPYNLIRTIFPAISKRFVSKVKFCLFCMYSRHYANFYR